MRCRHFDFFFKSGKTIVILLTESMRERGERERERGREKPTQLDVRFLQEKKSRFLFFQAIFGGRASGNLNRCHSRQPDQQAARETGIWLPKHLTQHATPPRRLHIVSHRPSHNISYYAHCSVNVARQRFYALRVGRVNVLPTRDAHAWNNYIYGKLRA